MSEEEVIKLLCEGKISYNELMYILNMDYDGINNWLHNLKQNRLNVYKKYYSDGSTRFYTPNYIDYEGDSTSIITRPDENTLSTLIISDLHLGCTIERLDLLYKTFEYAKERRIHIILGCGDLLDGDKTRSAAKSTIPDIYEQIEYIIKNYPQDKSILTFAVLGNHEGHAIKENSVDIAKMINDARNNLIISDTPSFCINIKNDTIKLKHKLEPPTSEKINIFGHTHLSMTTLTTNVNTSHLIGNARIFDKNLMVKCPSLSNGNQGVPAIMEMKLYFSDGYIYKVLIKEMGFVGRSNELVQLSKSDCEIFIPDREESIINNVENYPKENKTKKLIIKKY